MRVLVVDDEVPIRRRLCRLLAAIDGVVIAGEAGSGSEALEVLSRVAADLVLLDIHMPELDGIELAARYAHLPPVIFVTAHDEHAVRAFELNAIDYLLKPVRLERLAAALQRARRRGLPAGDGFRALAEARPPSRPAGDPPRVITRERGVLRLFDALALTRFHAADKYTLFVADGEEHLTEEPLAALEERLAPHGFVRVHRAELIRRSAVRALVYENGVYRAQLVDGQVANVSRRLASLLKDQLRL